jgi:uncharacterized protein (TIGR00255 family)
MLRSMTGFGAATLAADGWTVHAEARSVNHRHLLVKVRLAPELSAAEGELEAAVREAVERGSVQLLVEASSRAANEVEIDAQLAKRYRARLARLSRELGLDERPTLATLLALPGVVGAQAQQPAEDKRLRRALVRAAQRALAGLVRMRQVEGAAIGKDLARHARALARLARRIEKRMPDVVRGHQQGLRARVQALLGGQEALAPADLAREIALLSDRLDVSEELVRLASHLAQLDGLLARGGRVGRELDFLVQEVFRELNTIGSKCADARVAHDVIEAKAIAERLREQVQNLE